MKFMGVVAANAAGIRQDGPEVEAETAENSGVSRVHGVIGLLQAGLIRMKGVGIFHQKLPCAHDAKAGADFIPEFGLNLIEIGGQLLVTAQLIADQVGNDFLVGWAEAEGAVVTILHSQQFRPVLFPATGLLPEFRRLGHRHQDFHGAGPVHLFADNGLHFAQHPQSQRQPVVEPGGQLADHAGANHQLMADDFGIGRGFFLGSDQKLTGTHS